MPRRRFTFTAKQVGTMLLVVLADILVFGPWRTPAVGIFALGWAGVVLATVPHARRGGALVAGVVALLLGGVLLDDPSVLGWISFWIALALTALLARRRFDDASRWAERLVMHGLLGLAAPLRDARTLSKIKRGDRPSLRAILATIALPLIGSASFLALFAGANPLIGDAFAAAALPDGTTMLLHAVIWAGAILCVWPSVRPFPAALGFGRPSDIGRSLPHVPAGTLSLSLLCFNIVFGLQNVLDIVFLWSGAPLPGTVTLADYAHRGAYTLIATASLAGLFVLIALRPDSEAARSRPVRRLLILWIAQNVLLVASSALRLMDYIAAYSLTVPRISALAWMGLVAVGLVLVCWRLLANRSAAWLINTNAAAAALVLLAASAVDLGTVAARWNVRHARAERDLDLCYLHALGASALLPLMELEQRVAGDALRDRVAFVRDAALQDALARQAEPITASLRNARRIDAAVAALEAHPRRIQAGPRGCDGTIIPPDDSPAVVLPPPASPGTVADQTAALTKDAQR